MWWQAFWPFSSGKRPSGEARIPWRLAGLCLLLAVTACSGPDAEPQLLRVGVSADAAPAGPALMACAPNAENIQVEVEAAPPAAAVGDYDVLIRLGVQEEAGFAAQIAEERIVAVLNPGNPLSNVNRQTIAAIFSGRVRDGSDLGGNPGAIVAWAGLEGEEARALFETELLGGASVGGDTRLAGSPQQLLTAVAADPAAVGLLPAALADERVDVVELGLRVPVLATASTEPAGAVRQLIACLQSGAGQALLDAQYAEEP